MDSLLANYASSDGEEEEEQQQQPQEEEEENHEPKFFAGNSTSSDAPETKPSSSIFSSLPPPESSSLFSFLPPPTQTLTDLSSSKSNHQDQQDDDEEEEEEEQQLPQPFEGSKLPYKSNISFSGSPIERSPSLFSSLPQPKSLSSSSSSSSIFSSLPAPKSRNADPLPVANLSSNSEANSKKVIQLKLPVKPFLINSVDVDDERDDDDVKEKGGKKPAESFPHTYSIKSFLPAPKNSSTLGVLSSAAGSGRRSILEAAGPSANSNDSNAETEAVGITDTRNFGRQWVDDGSSSASLGNAGVSAEHVVGGDGDSSAWDSSGTNYENYGGYDGHVNYGYYGQYENNWADSLAGMVPPDTSGTGEVMVNMPGKRRRNEIPREIVEVKQDELVKNRPREDQAKLTGIAFGPSYQPVSTKGKPSKLHKRKHQIGALFYDMRQKEMELAERRAKGFLTKAETQGKYGW